MLHLLWRKLFRMIRGKNGGTLIPGNGMRGPGRVTLIIDHVTMLLGRSEEEAREYLLKLKVEEPALFARVVIRKLAPRKGRSRRGAEIKTGAEAPAG